jgi:hypothetical protein
MPSDDPEIRDRGGKPLPKPELDVRKDKRAFLGPEVMEQQRLK